MLHPYLVAFAAQPGAVRVVGGREVHRDVPVDLAALAVVDEQIDEKILGQITLSFAELIEKSGWTADELFEIFSWSATPVGDPTTPQYSQSDVDGLVELKALAEREGLDNQAIGTVARSISFSMERLALTQVEAIVHQLTIEGRSDTAARIVAAEIAPLQGEVLLNLIATLWRRNYAGAVHRLTTGAILHRGVSDDDRQFPLVCAIGYARVANFTETTAFFDVEDYTNFVQEFNNRTADIINAADGRIIKLMGDLMVWVAPNAETSADIATKIAALHENGFPGHLQVSLTWCRVMSINGDVFGPGVNLAAKLSEVAPLDSVLIDDAAAGQLARSRRFGANPVDPIELQGLGTVAPFVLTRQ